MQKLNGVTLIAYDNVQSKETLKVMRHCQRLFEFEESILVCNSDIKNDYIDIKYITETGYDAAKMWEVGGINEFVNTDFALFVSRDGFIMNAKGWKDEFLRYDFIGAPWPKRIVAAYRVGNMGFCLRSKKFMQACAEIAWMYRPNELASDVFCCQTMRPTLEQKGIKFANIDVAASFAWEENIEEHLHGRPDAFGFHKFLNKEHLRI